jgi:ABC-2 type transport system permease protein
MWTGDYKQGFYLLGMGIMLSASSIAKSIILDKLDRTIIRILAAPTNMLRYLTQNFLSSIIPLTFQIIIITIIGKFLYNWEIMFTIHLALCYTIFAMASITLLYAWSCLFKDKETSSMLFGFILMFAAMLGGFMLPLDLLPQTVQYFGAIFPAYWVSTAINELLTDGATLKYWLSLGAVLLFAIVYLLYGGKRRII